MTPDKPCLNCTRREVGCHSWCELGKADEAARKAAKDRERAQKKVQRDANEVKAQGIRITSHYKHVRKARKYGHK